MGDPKQFNSRLQRSSNLHDGAPLASSPKQSDALSDAEIWQKFRSGDEASFIHIYNKYFQSLYQYCHQFTSSPELVEDAIHDLFVELRQKRKTLVIKTSIRFYLLKSLKRKVIKLVKKRRKELFIHHQPKHVEFEVSFSIEQRLIESQIQLEQRQKLAEAIKKLTPRQREAIYYFFYENMSYAEIRELMEFTHIQAARNLMYRAIAELKKHLLLIFLTFKFLQVQFQCL